jgi:hypothetical protein
MRHRRIGTIGTAVRVVGGLSLLSWAIADGTSWGLAWHSAPLGLVVFPAVMVAFGFAAGRYAGGPVRFTGPLGLLLNTAVIVVLYTIDYTTDAAMLFYGVTLLVSAWRAQPGCEATVLSNWILGRDDQVGCPVLAPIDEAEARLTARHRRRRTPPGRRRTPARSGAA